MYLCIYPNLSLREAVYQVIPGSILFNIADLEIVGVAPLMDSQIVNPRLVGIGSSMVLKLYDFISDIHLAFLLNH